MKWLIFIMLLSGGIYGFQKYKGTIADLQSQLDSSTKALNDTQAQLNSVNSAKATLEAADNIKLAQLQADLGSKNELLNNTKIELTSNQTKLSQTQQQLVQSQTNATDLQKKLDQLTQQLANAQAPIVAQKQQQQAQSNAENDQRKLVNQLRQKAEVLKEQVDEVGRIYDMKVAQHIQNGFTYHDAGHELEQIQDLRNQIMAVNKQIEDVLSGKQVTTDSSSSTTSDGTLSVDPSLQRLLNLDSVGTK